MWSSRGAGVDDLAWREAVQRAGGADNPDRLWPVLAAGLTDLRSREAAQARLVSWWRLWDSLAAQAQLLYSSSHCCGMVQRPPKAPGVLASAGTHVRMRRAMAG